MAEAKGSRLAVFLRRIRQDAPESWNLLNECRESGRVTQELFNDPAVGAWAAVYCPARGGPQQRQLLLDAFGFNVTAVNTFDLRGLNKRGQHLVQELRLCVGHTYSYFNNADIDRINGGPLDEWLYLVWARETHRYKVGYSRCVKERIAGLRGASPLPLDLIAARNGTRETEGYIHHLLRDFRCHGEWFEHPDRKYITHVFLDGLPNLRKEAV